MTVRLQFSVCSLFTIDAFAHPAFVAYSCNRSRICKSIAAMPHGDGCRTTMDVVQPRLLCAHGALRSASSEQAGEAVFEEGYQIPGLEARRAGIPGPAAKVSCLSLS